MSQLLEESEIENHLENLKDWSRQGKYISKQFQFDNFVEAMAFVNRVAHQAESMQHHPDIQINYNKVAMSISSHDAGGLTTKDFQLAAQIDAQQEEA